MLVTPATLSAYPLGMEQSTYALGNEVCTLSGKVRTIKGSLQNCPQVFLLLMPGGAIRFVASFDLLTTCSGDCKYQLKRNGEVL
jgi:hypothetical protein